VVGLSRQIDTGFIQPCPDNQDFCDDIEDYPSDIEVSPVVALNSLIKDKLFPEPEPPLPPVPRNNDILRNFFEEEDSPPNFVQESQACRHRKSVVYPKKAKNTNGKYLFIVNKEEYKQSVDIEQCEGEGQPCETDGDAPQMNVGSTVCRQKFTTFKLYAINHEGEQIYDSFSLPSACLCYHKSRFSVRGSFAEPNDLFGSKSSQPKSLPVCPAESQKEPIENLVEEEKSTTPKSSSQINFSEESQNEPIENLVEAEKPTTPKSSSRINFQKRSINNRQVRQQQKRPSFKPKKCNGNSMFCEDKEDYPFNAIASVLKQDEQLSQKIFKEVFNSECKEAKSFISTRFLPTEEALCDSRPKVIYPQKALNLKNEWMYIVNLENYTQSVEIEECVDQTRRRQFSGFLEAETKFGVCLYGGAEGHNPDLTVCRQKYTEHKLLAFTADSELLVDSFKLPSACGCFIKEDFNFDFEIRQDWGDFGPPRGIGK